MVNKPERVGVVVLIKKRDAPASSHFGIKICQMREDGSADFSLPSQIVWRQDLEALLWGRARCVPAYLGSPLPLKENPHVSRSPILPKDSGGDEHG
jgi:hypothetical protein